MAKEQEQDGLDRHALVLSIWLPAGFVSAALFHHGFATGGLWWLAGGFGAVLATYACHVIVNVTYATPFSPREVALALVGTLACLLAFVMATFSVAGFAERFFVPLAGGFACLVAAVIAYMVIGSGPRRAFESFDIIRNNNPRRASRLPHRGGRR